MRIIKKGQIPIELECTCDVCGCVFAYNKEDVDNSVGCLYPDYWVICPSCGEKIYVGKFPECKN